MNMNFFIIAIVTYLLLIIVTNLPSGRLAEVIEEELNKVQVVE